MTESLVSPPSILPLKRARRSTGFAVRAESAAKQLALESRAPPTLNEIRRLIGGGSPRDLVAARKVAAQLLEEIRARAEAETQELREAVGATGEDVLQLREEVARLRAELAMAKQHAREEAVRFEGLRKHLLLETARMRDDLVRTKLPAMPGLRFERDLVVPSSLIHTDEDDPIFERG